MISHAIFASSPPTPAALPHAPTRALITAPRPHPCAHPRIPTMHPAMRFTPRCPCVPTCALTSAHQPAPRPCIPPRIPSFPSPCAPTPFPTTHFHRTSLLPKIPLAQSLPPRHSIFFPSTNFLSASLHPPCSSAKSRLWIFSCVKRPGSLTT